jgi:hypothetical protein
MYSVDDKDFKKAGHEFELLSCSFSFDVDEIPHNLQVKLIDLHSDNGLEEKFNFVKYVNLFGVLCDSKYSNFKDFGKKILSNFVSMYNCEQTFSLMKVNKSYIIVWMTGENLAAILHVTTSKCTPNTGNFLASVPSVTLLW